MRLRTGPLRTVGRKPASSCLPEASVVKQSTVWNGFQVCAIYWRPEKRKRTSLFDNTFLQIVCLDGDLSGEETQTIANH